MLCSEHPRDAVTTRRAFLLTPNRRTAVIPSAAPPHGRQRQSFQHQYSKLASLVERSEFGNTAQYFGGALLLVRQAALCTV